MRVALLHNRYIERGGEDAAVAGQVELLRKAGHSVRLFEVDNREEIAGTRGGALRAGLRARWNAPLADRAAAFAAAEPVDVAHVHNFFPLLSPAVHAALHARGIPTVQTLHNYRLLCADATLQRRGRHCEDCVARGPWNAVRHRCYRGSLLQTAVWSEQTAFHRRRGTWRQDVDGFTVPSAFAREKLLAAGLPPERVAVVPNPVPDPGDPRFGGRGAVFAGRLAPEKGLVLLLEAWRGAGGAPLLIVGSGPEEAALRRRAAGIAGVRFAGRRDRAGVAAALREASFLVSPSTCYETFGLVVAEAMACGTPALVPAGTALAECVDPGRSGLHFTGGDAASLGAACRRLLDDPAAAAAMGREARSDYDDRFAPEVALAALLSVYRRVIDARRAAAGSAAGPAAGPAGNGACP